MMTAAIYHPFLDATRDVFKLMLDLDVDQSDPKSIDHLTDCNDQINVSIGVIGDYTGEILYRFPKETTLKMVNIMSGMEITEVDDFVTSAIGEIANIISGKALIFLSEQNLTCDILPPKFVENSELLSCTIEKTSYTKINTSIGELELDISLK